MTGVPGVTGVVTEVVTEIVTGVATGVVTGVLQDEYRVCTCNTRLRYSRERAMDTLLKGAYTLHLHYLRILQSRVSRLQLP